jgi:hypothetical protein
MKSIREIRESIVSEGNPLSKLKKNIDAGRDFVAISAERGHLTPTENKGRMKELKSRLKDQGYGFKKTRGQWQGGSEGSVVVHAKGTSRRDAARLRYDMRKNAKHFDQDSIMHHNSRSKEASYIGTNKHYGMGKKEPQGRVIYNPDPADVGGETAYKKTARISTFGSVDPKKAYKYENKQK